MSDPAIWNICYFHQCKINVTVRVQGKYILSLFGSKIEKVPRGIRGEKSSKDMASSRNLVSTIGALARNVYSQETNTLKIYLQSICWLQDNINEVWS